MNYFNNCKTLDEAKNLFRKLCKEFHPDHGGNAKDFIRMHAEFKAFKPSEDKFNEFSEFDADKFYNLIRKFDGLNEIKISFVGSFIWLEDLTDGAMYEQKETIKSIKLDGYNFARWANKKKSWYFSPENYKKVSRKTMGLNEIKSLFGSQEFEQRKILIK